MISVQEAAYRKLSQQYEVDLVDHIHSTNFTMMMMMMMMTMMMMMMMIMIMMMMHHR